MSCDFAPVADQVQQIVTHRPLALRLQQLIERAMDVRHRLAANLRRLRNEAGLSQEDFANANGFDRTYISGMERAVRNPTLLIVERLATALGVDVTELICEPPARFRS